MILRRATGDDVRAIAALEASVFAGEAWSLASVVAEVSGRDRVALVVISAGELVGYAVTMTSGDVADLHRLAVRPSSRRRGLAGRLLAAATERATEDGAQRLLLEVSAENEAALRFYAAADFVEIDRRRRYYRDGSDALVLGRSLADPGRTTAPE